MSNKAKLISASISVGLIILALVVYVVTLQEDRKELTHHVRDLEAINIQNANVNTALNNSNVSLQDEIVNYKDSLEKTNSRVETLKSSLRKSDKRNEELLNKVNSLQKSNANLVAEVKKLKDASAKKSISSASIGKPSVSSSTVPPSRGTTPTGIEIYMSATAYTAFCNGCSGITRTGIDLRANPNLKVIAVDPSVIPLGSKVYVEGYGYAVAGDTGGAIKGHKIDIFMASRQQALNFGRKKVKVTILK